MITIPATNLQRISDFGLFSIVNDEQRYTFDTVLLAETLLENKFGTSNVTWNGKEIVVTDPDYDFSDGLSF